MQRHCDEDLRMRGNGSAELAIKNQNQKRMRTKWEKSGVLQKLKEGIHQFQARYLLHASAMRSNCIRIPPYIQATKVCKSMTQNSDRPPLRHDDTVQERPKRGIGQIMSTQWERQEILTQESGIRWILGATVAKFRPGMIGGRRRVGTSEPQPFTLWREAHLARSRARLSLRAPLSERKAEGMKTKTE